MKKVLNSMMMAVMMMLTAASAYAASGVTYEVEVGKTLQLDISDLGKSLMKYVYPTYTWEPNSSSYSQYFTFSSKQWDYAIIKGVKESQLIGIQYSAVYYDSGVRKEFNDVFYVKVVGSNTPTSGPTSIEVYPSPQTMKVGQTSTVYAKQTGAIGGTYFYSEDKSIATVTAGELASEHSYITVAEITAVSPGTVNIVAKSQNGIYAKCKVTVTAPSCTGISIPANREMNVGTTWTISPSVTPASAQPTLSWKSSNTTVATVTQAGVVTAKGVGTATITVTTDNYYSASCLITVKDPNPAPTAVTMEKEINLDVNQTYTLKPSVEPYNAKTTLTWKSSDTTVATVNQNGTVTAIAPGEAIITVTTDNGKYATCRVVIEGAVPMSEYDLTLYVNQGGKVICNNMLTRGFKKVLFYEDDDIVMTVLPDQGYQIAGIWVNGDEMTDKVNDDMLTISGINQNSYVVVSFELDGSSSSDSTKQGDVNKDGEVNISDVVKVINIIAGNNGD